MNTKLEHDYPAFENLALWRRLKESAQAEGLGTDFLEGVGAVCHLGLTLSKDINRFFPNFTLHDETHIVNVCRWMVRLLEGPEAEQNPQSHPKSILNALGAREAAMLVMAACCHDCGMSVDSTEALRAGQNPHSQAWTAFFQKHPREEADYRRTGKLSDETLRSYVRCSHHLRIQEQLLPEAWPAALTAAGLTRENLICLCRSHGEPLEKLELRPGQHFDLRLCAVLLRLADILDFDASRAPEALFLHRGLNAPANLEQRVSQTEWGKNRAGVFRWTPEGELSFTASFSDLQLEMEVRAYLEWVERELTASIDCLRQSRRPVPALPFRVLAENVDRQNYRFGDFRLTMDQDKVRELLAGRNLYQDGGVFVRELLQNAIDAILTRRTRDPAFAARHGGRVSIRSWRDAEGYDWFRIEDDGIGMGEEEITGYFLKVGCSYYTSRQFEADQLRYGAEGSFKPISRFGIGVLSCFMSDPEHNRLELSTRKLSPDPLRPNDGLRLSVTGLHGYYGLMGEGDGGSPRPLPCPPGTREPAFREEPGTTLCVRTSLFELGEYRSFREILDRYLCFPDVEVEYLGPEGSRRYPTKGELMGLAHRLNPQGPKEAPKAYSIPLPEEALEELKRCLPMVIWKRPPALTLRLHPLDWRSEGEAVSGLAAALEADRSYEIRPVQAEGRSWSGELMIDIDCRAERQTVHLAFVLWYPNDHPMQINLPHREGLRSGAFFGEADPLYGTIYDWWEEAQSPEGAARLARKAGRTEAELRALVEKMRPLMGSRDADAFRYDMELPYSLLWQGLPGIDDQARELLSAAFGGGSARHPDDASRSVTAFQGVCVDRSDLLGLPKSFPGLCLLLGGNQAPEVDLGRAGIIGLPPALCVELQLLQEALAKEALAERYSSRLDALSEAAGYALRPARELRGWMEAHPLWQRRLSCRPQDLDNLEEEIDKAGSAELPWAKHGLFQALQAAVWTSRFSLLPDGLTWIFRVRAVRRSSPAVPEALPALLFVSPAGGVRFHIASFIYSYGISHPLYNSAHPLSQWLFRQQPALAEKVPKLYGLLLRKLWDGGARNVLRREINGILELLRDYPSNEFGVEDSLFLTVKDFAP